MNINQKTTLYGVVGHPVGHSLSPLMLNTAFSEMGLNSVYLAFDTKNIEDCIKGIRSLGIKGISVTIPYKSTVIPFLDEVDDLALKIGAVNTVVNKDGLLIGYNTDAIGALKALSEKTDISRKSCILLGAGGAARAIGYVLKENGVNLTIVNRSKIRGKDLANSLACEFIPLKELSEQTTDILINTTPIGMHPHTESCPIPEKFLKKGMVVMDIIYNPLETKFITLAKEKGCLVVDGLGMFVYQGAEQFKLWTGLEPSMVVMTEVVKKGLIK